MNFWKAQSGQFSYNANAETCRPEYDLEHAVDPITVIARLHHHSFLPDRYAGSEKAGWENAGNHLEHHGWNQGRSLGQYFRDDTTSGSACVEGEISLADEVFGLGADQWHSRGHWQELVSDPYHVYLQGDIQTTAVISLTPHYDEDTSDLFPPYNDCAPLVDHYVEEDYDPDPIREFSGFDRAREELIALWLDDPDQHHDFVESQFWGRPSPRRQCNGDMTSSNGYVYHIGLCFTDYPC